MVLFFVLHLNANFFFGAQQSPFIYWNLYPSPIPEQSAYSFYEVVCDGQVVSAEHTWQEPGTLLTRNTVKYFMFMKNNGKSPLKDYIDRWNKTHPWVAAITPGIKFYPDTTEMNLFPDWLAKRMEHLLKRPVHHMGIYEVTVKYSPNGTVQPVSRREVWNIR